MLFRRKVLPLGLPCRSEPYNYLVVVSRERVLISGLPPQLRTAELSRDEFGPRNGLILDQDQETSLNFVAHDILATRSRPPATLP